MPPSKFSKKRQADARSQRPPKKQKRSRPSRQQYHSSDSESEAPTGQAGASDDFDPVNLLDSDDDIHNATIDQAGDSDDNDDASSAEEEVAEPPKASKKQQQPASKKKMTIQSKKAVDPDESEKEEEEEEEEEDEDEGSSDEDDEDDYEGDDFDEELGLSGKAAAGSKKRDNSGFAKSLNAILSTKLTSSKRSDPVLSRSLEAQQASRALLDNALEAKARKQLRDQKRLAHEKGRVRDVLVATRNDVTGEAESTTSEVLGTERRLRKVAQRGVVKLFNAVRAAQVAALEADRDARREGVIGMDKRVEKVNDMTKKGFLDLIASGGGGLSKAALEEA